MRIEGNPILNSEFVSEFQNYLSGKKKPKEMVKLVKKTDFEKLPVELQTALHSMIDSKGKISEEVFKRQLELYFALMEDKDGPQRMPVFSDYVEKLYSQESKDIPDKMFSLMTSKLLKTKAKQLPESVSSFFDGLTEEYKRDIDKMSNERLGVLINILNSVDLEYEQMPEELRNFVREMFIRCAVKTEISDRNVVEIQGLFRGDHRTYYNWFNKAFAGYGQYETWIDTPAKKLTLKNMINYANLQNLVVRNGRRGLGFQSFQSQARSLGLRRLPEYKPGSLQFGLHYLKEPREYKDYAKKMTGLFTQMIKTEVEECVSLKSQGMLSKSRAYRFGQTLTMCEDCDYVEKASIPKEYGKRYANFLISLVHLDKLMGLTRNQIYEEIGVDRISSKNLGDVWSQSVDDVEQQRNNFDVVKSRETPSERYEELIEEYNLILLEGGKPSSQLVDEIMNLEDMLRAEMKEDESQPSDE